MENAVQALKMAAAVLIFIIALGTSFYMFGMAKNTADSIIGMRDKQSYLEAAELDNGILYTSSESIAEGRVTAGVTTDGDRVVDASDIISTLYRYASEKYAVTFIKDEKIIARFDSSLESIIQNSSTRLSNTTWTNLETQVINNLKNKYATSVGFKTGGLRTLYKITNDVTGIEGHGAPWLGNASEIKKRIDADINKTGGVYTYNHQKYEGKKILNEIEGHTVIEVLNEIDESEYIYDGTDDTGLIKEYQMPTVEVIYVIQ